jgi:arylsulfatase A-like enzyme
MTARWTARLAAAVRGAVLGAVAGGLWAAAEFLVNWAGGGTAPPETLRTIASLDLMLGATVGALAGLVAPGATPRTLALVLVLAYGFVRIVAPPGVGAEAIYIALAAAAFAAFRWLGRGTDTGLLAFVHVVLLGTLGLLAGELWLDARHANAMRGALLPLTCLGLLLVVPLVDRLMTFVVRGRGARMLLQAGAVAIAIAMLGTPLDARPLEDAVVTSVPPPAGTPDVILVSLDTTRADRLSTYGYERDTSPNLTRLAADGELYRNARSPAGWTLPAHASMMTGLFPHTHGATLAGGFLGGESVDGRLQVAHPLKASAVTLAEVLRDRGYRTGAFVANFSYLYRDYGLAQGFGTYEDAPGLLLRVRPPVVRLGRQFVASFCVKPFRTARSINASAIGWLDAQPADRPVFLFVNYMEPHQPWMAEPPHDRWAHGLTRGRELARKNLYTHAVGPIDADTTAFIGAHYDGQVAAMDEALGELVTALRARGRYENALVVVAGDHGELLGEHGQMGHMGRMLYEPLLRVPLVVKHPGTGPRGVVDTPVQLVDLMPTIVEAAGASLPEGLEGTRLADVARPPFAEEGINPFLVRRYGDVYDRSIQVLYDGDYKLIVTSRGERLLFDLGTDPHERVDLAGREPARVQELSQRLELRTARLAATQFTEKVR